MEAPEKVIRYQKRNVDFRIFADTPEFVESCDKDFEGMDDVTRTEYIRADLLAAKEADLEKVRTHLRELLGVKVLGRYDTAELFELIGIVGERLVSEARAALKGVE